ncbi:MAG: serine/threonine-protein kinase [Betaproteobacteria bacterium]|nr:serine/threonine-protein kinase [Betaproteobacteria bacterium]
MSARRAPERVGKYPVLRKLGEGASSEVYLCRDPFGGRDVAVKRIFPEILGNEARGRLYRKLFLAEASLTGKLVHPHIVQIYDAALEDDTGYIVMEYVPGGTLEPFCDPHNLLPIDKIIEIAFKCTRALAFAHGFGITHRDIKPGNILVAGATDIKISDFGAALSAGAETTQVSGVGSPAYMSPEQVREETLDLRTDIYSLGVVMYQLLTGVLPYRAGNNFGIIYQIANLDPPPPSAHRADLPLVVDRIVRRAMEKDLARRYQSWEEVSRDLAEAFRADRAAASRDALGDSEKFNALRAMGFFRHFSDGELWQVVALMSWERVAAGTELMREGGPGDFFCVLIAGEMRVSKSGKLLSVLGPGECIGEMAYLSESDKRRRATVTAGADSRIGRIRIADLEQAAAACRHKFDRAFMVKLVERLSQANVSLAVSA